MRRSTLLELSDMELHEVVHVRRCFAGELAQGVRHASRARASRSACRLARRRGAGHLHDLIDRVRGVLAVEPVSVSAANSRRETV
jgi:hypothetical protein